MAEFNPKAARSKRPLPFWVDAFHRDTQDLSVEEIGAYMLLLAAMWSRETCDLPDDDRRLARVCRVTESKWKRGLGSVMRSFLVSKDGMVTQKRLLKEAVYVEQFVKEQSDRKKGKEARKPLKNKEQASSADDPRNIHGESPENPTQQPNNPTVKIERAKALLSSGADEISQAFAAYNDMASRAGLPQAQALTEKRKSALRGRLKDAGGIDGWRVALEKVAASPLCTGQNDRGWRADLDFICTQSKFVNIMEGRYDRTANHNARNGGNAGRGSAHDNLLAGFQASAADEPRGGFGF